MTSCRPQEVCSTVLRGYKAPPATPISEKSISSWAAPRGVALRPLSQQLVAALLAELHIARRARLADGLHQGSASGATHTRSRTLHCPLARHELPALIGDGARARHRTRAPLRLHDEAFAALAHLSLAALRLCDVAVGLHQTVSHKISASSQSSNSSSLGWARHSPGDTKRRTATSPRLHSKQLPPGPWGSASGSNSSPKLSISPPVMVSWKPVMSTISPFVTVSGSPAVAIHTSCIASKTPAQIPWSQGSSVMLSLSSSSSSTGMSAFKCCGSNCPQSLLDFNVRRARHFRICSLMPTGPSTSTRRSSDHFGPGGRDADLHLGPLALTLIAGVSIFTSIPCAMLALSKSLCRRLRSSGSTIPGRRTTHDSPVSGGSSSLLRG